MFCCSSLRMASLKSSIFLALITGLPLLASGQSNEWRAFWADAFGAGFKNAAQVTTFIDNVRAANANAIVPEIRKRGDAYYNRSIYEPKPTDISPSSFDPLADMIAKAHDTSGGKQRIEVHAWIVSYKIWGSQSTAPPASNPPHPYNAHPDWLTQDVNGALWDGGSYSFDPGHPDVQRYTFNVCMDIISRYDMDGFNFDYIRYTGNAWGYHPVTVARFNARYGRTGQPSPTDALWRQFRRDQVTALVRKVYLHTMATKPWVKISADTITWGNNGVANDTQWYSSSAAWNDVLQDWRGWMQEGILDLNIPMNYYRHHNTTPPTDHATAYTNWMNFAKDRKFNRHLAIGPGTYLNYTSNAIIQMRATRAPSPLGNYAEGVCAYVYKQPDNQGTGFATFKNFLTNSPNAHDPVSPPIFAIRVPAPDMPWKSAPTRGHLMGTAFGGSSTNSLDGAVVTVSGPVTRSQTNDATGFYGFVDLPAGSYTVTAAFPGYTNGTTNVTITVGNVATRDFVLGLQGPPAIAAQPQNQTVYSGAVANFTVTVSGPTPLSYQWQRNGTSINGATSSLLTINPATTNHAGNYVVVVTNSYGAITSDVVTLTVIVPPPNARLLPRWNLPVGSRAYLTTGNTERGLAFNPVSERLLLVGRAGSPQVYALNPDTGADLHTLNLGSGIIFGGTYHLQLVGAADDGAVYVCNLTLNSSIDEFRLYRWANDNSGTMPTVAFSGNPDSTNPQRWGDSMDVRGAGAGTQILIASRQGTNAVVFTTANGTAFTPNPVNVSSVTGGAFGLGVAFGAGNTFWGKAVGQPLRRVSFNLASNTGSVQQTYGSPGVASSISAIGVSTNLNVVAGVAIETPDNLKLYDILPNDTVTLVETNAFPTDNENSNLTGAVDFDGDRVFALDSNNGIVALQVLPRPVAPTISIQPQNLTVVEGDDASFFVSAAGTPPLDYQWRFNGGIIAGATKTNYTRVNAQATDAGGYSVVITNVAGAITSSVATLTVNVPPEITTHPVSQSVKAGTNATFSVTATGTPPLAYQWKFDNANIPGETNSSLALSFVDWSDEGEYTVAVTNLAGSAFSTPAALTVLPPDPSQIDSLVVLPDGRVQLQGSGDSGNYIIEYSTNLVVWEDLANVLNTNGAFWYLDDETNAPYRFYRARR